MTKQFCFPQEMSVTDTSKNLMSKLGLRFLLQVATDYKVSMLRRRNGSFHFVSKQWQNKWEKESAVNTKTLMKSEDKARKPPPFHRHHLSSLSRASERDCLL